MRGQVKNKKNLRNFLLRKNRQNKTVNSAVVVIQTGRDEYFGYSYVISLDNSHSCNSLQAALRGAMSEHGEKALLVKVGGNGTCNKTENVYCRICKCYKKGKYINLMTL